MVPITLRNEPAWAGNPFKAVEEAREQAWQLRHDCSYIQAHSTMLSAYIGSLGNIQSGSVPKSLSHVQRLSILFWWSLLAEYHALSMRRKKEKLDHNQLDVLSTWLIKTAGYIYFRKSIAKEYALRCVKVAAKTPEAKPHQRALAYITCARAYALRPVSSVELKDVQGFITTALNLDSKIRAEPDQPQGLRQLVRILKNAGKLEEYILGENSEAYTHYSVALALAEGEANTESQAVEIRALLRHLSLHWAPT